MVSMITLLYGYCDYFLVFDGTYLGKFFERGDFSDVTRKIGG